MCQNAVRLEFSLQTLLEPSTTVLILGLTLAGERALTRSDTAAVGNYLNDDTVPLKDRGAPWLDVAEAAGVILPETTHFKPGGL